MRYFSLKIIVVCILLPPVLYIISVNTIERYFHTRFSSRIEESYLGDTQPLLDGRIRLQDAVTANIDRYLQSELIIGSGLEAAVTVRSKNGRILYPTAYVDPDGEAITPDPAQIAAENFELMTKGLGIEVDTKLAHNSLLSISLLILFLLVSVSVLSLHYRAAALKAKLDEQKKKREIDRLREAEKESEKRLSNLMHTREGLDSEFKRLSSELESEKSKADQNESDWIEEIEKLEARLNENLALQQTQQEEIAKLEESMKALEKSRRKMDKQNTKAADAAGKRFATLYKNLTVHERALSGYIDLSEDMKIKAEEVIHQLNEDADKVTIKRKVFGKKGHATVLEVLFAYKGRLYFRKSKEKQVEILAIGTKNTQARELEFLSKL